ncbi:GntR family transcriptional regulator [Pseudoroseomonas deserti]|uniref:GntR family transcriptional regulator n=2 Tax=Teichococcus deserti TaxID=1817963 RepID=A0A1V2GX61_9PROT|nr:GntR family transcriptional regulator [Pseudoroseomonas deserti]
MRMTDFRDLADGLISELTADLAAGRRRPGERLPPSRDYAHARGIAPSTASRVYAELVRRGVAVGEVGRGTFLRAGAGPLPGLPSLPARETEAGGVTDLEVNFSVLAGQEALLAPGLARLADPAALLDALQRGEARGTGAARRAVAGLLARDGWAPQPEELLFAGRGQQALAAVFAALLRPGDRLGMEAMTYPLAKGMALRLGLQPQPIAMDEHGLRPESVVAAHRAHPFPLLYVQSELHNPLGHSMPVGRRAELAAVLRQLDILAVEDAVYSFLAPGAPPPLAAHAPERVVLVDSLSKRVAPGLTLGFLVAPPGLRMRLAASLRLGGWTAGSFVLAVATAWMEDGSIRELQRRKQADGAARNALVRQVLGGAGLALQGDPRAYHLWLTLPGHWRAETFVAAAARRRIAVSPAAEFAVVPGHAPDAVRLALASPPEAALRPALELLRDLALAGPETGAIG